MARLQETPLSVSGSVLEVAICKAELSAFKSGTKGPDDVDRYTEALEKGAAV